MPWVDISEAAFTLGVSERTIRNWIKSGKLQARSLGGRREVEIPEPDHGPTAQAFTDDEHDSGQPIETQKRLEVALIECGRVKGTLASQERMMESLSSNIAELNAKLQRSERTIGRRTVWCVIIAFLGIGAWSLSRSWYTNDILKKRNEHMEEIISLKTSNENALKEKDIAREKALRELRLEKDNERAKALKDLTDRLVNEYKQKIEELKTSLGDRIKQLEDANMHLRGELDKEKSRRMKAETERNSIQKDLENAEARRAETESLVKLQKSRLEEVEKSRGELEAELARWKKYYRRDQPPTR